MTANDRCVRGQGRDRIVDSALRLIGRHGLHALRLRDVADDAGMSLGSTTYHFTGREDLVMAALARHVHQVAVECEDFLTGEYVVTPNVTRARELLEEFADFYSYAPRVWVEHELHIEAARTGDPRITRLRDKSIAARSSLLTAAFSLVMSGRREPARVQWIANRALAFADGIALRHPDPDALPMVITWHLESFFNYQSPTQMSDPFADAPTPAAYWATQPTAITLGESA